MGGQLRPGGVNGPKAPNAAELASMTADGVTLATTCSALGFTVPDQAFLTQNGLSTETEQAAPRPRISWPSRSNGLICGLSAALGIINELWGQAAETLTEA